VSRLATRAARGLSAVGQIGSRVQRKEDDRLLRGAGQFTDDIAVEHGLEMSLARCPFPHARVRIADISLAAEVEGVHGILTGADVLERSRPMTVLRPVPGAPDLGFPALATEVALFEGHPVVSVVADSRAIAEDALDLVEIEYEPLPHVSDVIAAMEPDAPKLHPHVLSSNLLTSNTEGTEGVASAFEAADVTVDGRFRIGRVTPLPMETRAVIASWVAARHQLEVRASTQTPQLFRKQLAEILDIDEAGVKVIAEDVGGGFGQKLGVYPEDVLACMHSIELGRPVKWVEDRVEHFRAATQGREALHDFRIAADADGRVIAMTDEYTTDLGAYNSPFGSAQLSSVVFTGPYRVRQGSVRRNVVITNKTPIGAYRGYGQPEVNFAREQLVDRLARRLGIDPLEIRLKNMLTPKELPWTNTVGVIYESGDYPRCLEMAAEAVEYDRLRAAERGPLPDGRYRGVGLSAFVERTGYAGSRFLQGRGSRFGAHESVILRGNRSGTLELYTALPPFGTSMETTLAQVCASVHGISFDLVRVIAGDTGTAPMNTGSFASRTMIAAGGAVADAAAKLRGKTLRIAANLLGDADPSELEIDGDRVIETGEESRSIRLEEVHQAAIEGRGLDGEEEPGLEVTAHFEPDSAAFAYGSAAAVVIVDSDTGEFEIERFVMVHDCGVAVNPTVVEGQVRGGLAQGFGAALAEELHYDPETGQLLNGTMLDYFVPSAMDIPPIELRHSEVPSTVTPFGVRGVGEAGTIPPGATIANGICDALAHFDLTLDSLPITPEKVWRAIRASEEMAGS
jgi:aerobic carbon-monoxide dehydrogenase large subunit